ncbi:hypothetical protein [Pedobacter agri]|uniref:hypothetical protein n=1 Tax=Pedobacter agri TaxID=454586 RepID=UPI0029309994|nr:hypothetical protein [Pedobacter agri]
MTNEITPAATPASPDQSPSGSLSNIRNLALTASEYSARITRKNPAAIVIMIDQSASMNQTFDAGRSKAKIVADLVNELLQDLLLKCVKANGLRNYFHILVFGYGEKINLLWEGGLKGKTWVSVEELKENIIETRSEEAERQTTFGIKKYIKDRYRWISEASSGRSTSMKQAFEYCHALLEKWTLENDQSFPPMVFNITDGYPTDINDDYDLWLSTCHKLTARGTADGNTLLFNILLTKGTEIIMPGETQSRALLSHPYHRAMVLGSSELPPVLRPLAHRLFAQPRLLSEPSRCLIINCTPNSVLGMLKIGTNTIVEHVRD